MLSQHPMRVGVHQPEVLSVLSEKPFPVTIAAAYQLALLIWVRNRIEKTAGSRATGNSCRSDDRCDANFPQSPVNRANR